MYTINKINSQNIFLYILQTKVYTLQKKYNLELSAYVSKANCNYSTYQRCLYLLITKRNVDNIIIKADTQTERIVNDAFIRLNRCDVGEVKRAPRYRLLCDISTNANHTVLYVYQTNMQLLSRNALNFSQYQTIVNDFRAGISFLNKKQKIQRSCMYMNT